MILIKICLIHLLLPKNVINRPLFHPFPFHPSRFSMRTILFAGIIAAALCISGSNGKQQQQQFMKKDFHARRAEAAKRYYHSNPLTRQTTTSNNITFSNPKASGSLASTIFAENPFSSQTNKCFQSFM